MKIWNQNWRRWKSKNSEKSGAHRQRQFNTHTVIETMTSKTITTTSKTTTTKTSKTTTTTTTAAHLLSICRIWLSCLSSSLPPHPALVICSSPVWVAPSIWNVSDGEPLTLTSAGEPNLIQTIDCRCVWRLKEPSARAGCDRSSCVPSPTFGNPFGWIRPFPNIRSPMWGSSWSNILHPPPLLFSCRSVVRSVSRLVGRLVGRLVVLNFRMKSFWLTSVSWLQRWSQLMFTHEARLEPVLVCRSESVWHHQGERQSSLSVLWRGCSAWGDERLLSFLMRAGLPVS